MKYRGRETLKIVFFYLLFIVCVGISGAQEVEGIDQNPANSRPPETELILDQPIATGVETREEGVALPGLEFADFARMILVLGIVIALIYGFFWILKRFSTIKPEGEDAIRLLSTRPLKGDTALHLVEAGNRIFLVGSTSSTVNLLSEINDKESMDEIRLMVSRRSSSVKGGFSRLLRKRFREATALNNISDSYTNGAENDTQDPAAYLQQQRGRLQNL